MEKSETTENERNVLKTVALVTNDKQKNNCGKKGEPKTDTDLEAMKEMVLIYKYDEVNCDINIHIAILQYHLQPMFLVWRNNVIDFH